MCIYFSENVSHSLLVCHSYLLSQCLSVKFIKRLLVYWLQVDHKGNNFYSRIFLKDFLTNLELISIFKNFI